MSTDHVKAIDWTRVRGVIFDVDGTLYGQRRLRFHLALELLSHTVLRLTFTDLRIILRFRRLREKLAESSSENVRELQYQLVAQQLKVSENRVVAVIEEWIETRPLNYLRAARFPGVVELFDRLSRQGIQIGILSDYPVPEKLAVLELYANATCCTVEVGAGRLKPDPFGLKLLLSRLEIDPSECVMIGDRVERDGACAAAMGIPFIVCDNSSFYIRLLKALAAEC